MPSATAAPAKKASSALAKKSEPKKSTSGKNHKRVIYEEQCLSKSSTRRLAHKAGARYIGGKVYDDVSSFVHNNVESILRLSVLTAENAGKTTITRNMVLHAIRLQSV